MSQFLRDDFDRWHDYHCLIKQRTVYFGSFEVDLEGTESGVDAMSVGELIRNLLYLDKKAKKRIDLHFSSPGGNWDRGISAYDCILELRSPVRFIGYGCVRSMGTVICQACDERFLMPRSRFMIHEGWAAIAGHNRDVELTAEEFKVVRYQMYEVYGRRMREKNKKITIEQIEEMCKFDNYMSPQETVELGLADRVLG